MSAEVPELPAIGITWPGGFTQLRATVSGDSLVFESITGGTPSPIATYDLTAPTTDTLGELASSMSTDNPIGATFSVQGAFSAGDAASLLVDQVVTWSTFQLSPLLANPP